MQRRKCEGETTTTLVLLSTLHFKRFKPALSVVCSLPLPSIATIPIVVQFPCVLSIRFPGLSCVSRPHRVRSFLEAAATGPLALPLADGVCEDKSRFCDILKLFHS